MALRITESCFGCGACEFGCPQGAIAQADGFPVVYEIDPLLCNDCEECVGMCPVVAFEVDPAWAVCEGRGCPLSSKRYAGWRCTQGAWRCEQCGSMLWQAPDSTEWVCRRCTLAEGQHAASCPKVAKAERDETSSAAGARVPTVPIGTFGPGTGGEASDHRRN